MTTARESHVAPPADDDAAGAVAPAAGAAPAAPPCSDEPLPARIEALLLCSDRPLSEARLAALLGTEGTGGGAADSVRAAIEELNRDYDRTGRAFRARRIAGGWQLLTCEQFAPLLARLHDDRRDTRLSQAALETLAIIAYRQPILRAEIEAIRGVACGEVLRALLDRRLIKVTGRAEQLGRPMLYGTTSSFLRTFGLGGLEDLPALQGTQPASGGRPRPAGEAAPPAEEPADPDA